MSAMSGDGGTSYKRAGVDLEAASRSLDLITRVVEETYTAGVIRGLGSFGGLFEVPAGYERPVLVASTDGVGTKVMVASALADRPGALEGIGRDLVNHCVNDILVQGARPLFFLDYVASGALVPESIARLVTGVAAACRAAGAALLGGETAEMPGVYQPGEHDLVGTIIGIVEHDQIVDGSTVAPGDALLALPSGGLQTNGFSLARSVLAGAYDEPLPASSRGRADAAPRSTADAVTHATIGAALLAEHRSFLPVVAPLLTLGAVKAMAHITGGGIPGNLTRSFPAGLGATVRRGTWHEPAIFDLIGRRGGLADDEMFRAFNMGVGFVVVAARARVEELIQATDGALTEIGVVTGSGRVEIVGQ
jgi:phosphoribosylformylglycinamidine cyclo-ligase